MVNERRVVLPVRRCKFGSRQNIVKPYYIAVVLFLDIILRSMAAGETSAHEDSQSNLELFSIENVPLSLIEEIGSMSWSSVLSDYAAENGSLYEEVDQDYMNLHFSVGPDSGLDLQHIQDEVLKQISELLGSDQSFKSVALIACTQEDLVMYLQLRYSITLDYEHQKRVIKTMYNAVELDGYLGQLNVFHLYVQNTRGFYIRIDDVCDFEGCQSGITCVPTENQCTWNCSLNIGYCPENSQCIDKQTNGFICRCDHDTKHSRCENTTQPIPTSVESPWTKIIFSVTGSVLLCVLVVCITVRVLQIYYKKQTGMCSGNHERVIDFQNNCIATTAASETVGVDISCNHGEFQYLLPMESDVATLLPTSRNSLTCENGEINNAFLLVDNHEHF
ncbi:uncharacterized protein [Antedon mediterranea]|uniref:uncharacterized protein n=1 Tax=Antedon mediterranea TaxID=105859 RepID=UPI003AF8A0E5